MYNPKYGLHRSWSVWEDLDGIITASPVVASQGVNIRLQRWLVLLMKQASKIWGHFVDYVTDLMRLAHEAGRINVCVLTDYEIDGINMWRIANKKMRINIKMIGITQDIVKWLQQNGHDDIDLEDVEEASIKLSFFYLIHHNCKIF